MSENHLKRLSSSEFSRYFCAGSLTFVADFLILLVLTEACGISYLWSNLAGVSVGIILNYLLCVLWVFRERRYSSASFEFPLFVLICLAGILLNEGLLWMLVEFAGLHYLAAKVPVTAVTFVFSFSVKKIALFRPG